MRPALSSSCLCVRNDREKTETRITAEPWSMRVDLRDVHSLEHDTEFLRVLTDMIGATVFWEGRLCVFFRRRDSPTSRGTLALIASPLPLCSPKLLEQHSATDWSP